MNELQPHNPSQISRREQPNPGDTSVSAMIQLAIEKGITPEALEKLCDLKIKMDSESARREFAHAFAELQSELPRVIAMKPVTNKDGTIRYVYAPMESIMEQIGPALARHGFSVSFTTRNDAADNGGRERLCAVCTVTHSGGHSQSNEFAVRTGQGPPGSSDAQADMSTRSYAKRGALCDAFNITVHRDDDARQLGAYITSDQARELEERVKKTNSNVAAFLKVADAKLFSEIREGKYATLDRMLRQKEAKSAAEKKDAEIVGVENWDDFKDAAINIAGSISASASTECVEWIGIISQKDYPSVADRMAVLRAIRNGNFDWKSGKPIPPK
jgi:DNA-binding TFAR19-related protein (PDSD5 family)